MNSNLNKYDYLYLTFSNLICLIVSIIFDIPLILIVTTIAGINYTYFIAKGRNFAHVFGVINLSLYAIYLLMNNIYALGIYNLVYALPMCIYGYYYWSRESNKNKVNQLNNNFKIALFFLIIFSIYILYIVLNILGGSVPFFDALSTVLCTLGTLLTSTKYKEQWPVWLIANFVNIIIFIVFSVEDINNISVLFMWIIHFINSIYGYYNWNKGSLSNSVDE